MSPSSKDTTMNEPSPEEVESRLEELRALYRLAMSLSDVEAVDHEGSDDRTAPSTPPSPRR